LLYAIEPKGPKRCNESNPVVDQILTANWLRMQTPF